MNICCELKQANDIHQYCGSWCPCKIYSFKKNPNLLLFIILMRFAQCKMQGVAHNHCGSIVTVLSNRRRGAGVRGILGYVRCAVFRFSLDGNKRKFYTRVQLVSRLFSDRKTQQPQHYDCCSQSQSCTCAILLIKGCLCTFHRIVLSYGLQIFVSLLSSTLLTCIQWVADKTNKNTVYHALTAEHHKNVRNRENRRTL